MCIVLLIAVYMSGFMKTVLKTSRPNRASFSRQRIKSKVFFLLHSFICLLLLSFPYFSLFCMAWRLPLRVVKSKWNIDDWVQIVHTVFIIQSYIVQEFFSVPKCSNSFFLACRRPLMLSRSVLITSRCFWQQFQWNYLWRHHFSDKKSVDRYSKTSLFWKKKPKNLG